MTTSRSRDTSRAEECAYTACHRPGRRIDGMGRGFIFCRTHTPAAKQLLFHPKTTRRGWPAHEGAQ